MKDSMASALNLPKGLPTARYRPSPKVEVPGGVSELPLMDEKTPANKKVQEHWKARIRSFDLTDPADVDECQRVWQHICDGLFVLCQEKTEFSADGRYVQLLRWAELEYKVPTQE